MAFRFQARPDITDRDIQSIARRGGRDPQEMEALFGRVLSYIHRALPDPPVSADGQLCILFDADGGGVDRLSRLPDTLLCDIVSRLPIKDAARTAVLSRRWSPIWRAAPLVLVDTHLLPAGDDEIPINLDHAHSDAVAASVSRILVAHPGPFRCVRLTCCYMEEDRARVERWLKLLASKGVQQLFLINRPWPLTIDKHLPATFFSMTALTRLYLGFWRFPDTAALPRGAAFPCLRELGLCSTIMDNGDMDFVLARSPVLEILNIEGHLLPPLRLRIISHSLRCVQIHGSTVDSIAVEDARRLERLFLGQRTNEDSCCKIKIRHAPALRLFGDIELEKDELQVGNTIIKAGSGAVVNPSVMLPAVTILNLNVRFGVRKDSKMLPTILRCFPNIEKLHIHCKETTESTGRLSIKFWKESGAIKCVMSSISMLSVYDFRGERSELAFLKFFIESAQMLKVLVVVYANGFFSSRDEANFKVKALFAGRRATQSCEVVVCESRFPEGGRIWDFKRGSDFSFSDPFGVIGCSSFGVSEWSV